MADVNYVNPTAIRPEYNWKPSGVLAGMLYAQDRQRYDQVADLQDQMMGHAAAKSREDLIQGAPVRQAERDATLRDLPMKSRELAATTEGKELGTEFTRATQPGRIGATNAQSEATVSNQNLLQMQNRMAVAEALSRIGGPAAVPQMAQILKQSGMNMQDPFIQSLLNVPDPSQVPARARAAREALSAAYSQEMDKERMQQAGADRRVERQGWWSVEVAKQRSASRTLNMIQRFEAAKTTEVMQALGEMILVDPEIDEGIKMRVRAAVEQARRSEAAKRAGGQVQIPGLPQPGATAPEIQQRLAPPQAGQPSANDPLGLRR